MKEHMSCIWVDSFFCSFIGPMDVGWMYCNAFFVVTSSNVLWLCWTSAIRQWYELCGQHRLFRLVHLVVWSIQTLVRRSQLVTLPDSLWMSFWLAVMTTWSCWAQSRSLSRWMPLIARTIDTNEATYMSLKWHKCRRFSVHVEGFWPFCNINVTFVISVDVESYTI